MKIAFFTDTYRPQINGVVTSIDSFASQLRKQGHTVEIFSPRSKGFHSVSFAPYPEYKIGVPSKEPIESFHKKGFDIVHIHTPMTIGTLGLGLAKHLRLPRVFTFHTLLPEYLHYLKVPKGFLRTEVWRYCSWFSNRMTAVIAPSEPIADLLRSKGVNKPIVVIPTGIKASKRKKSNRGKGKTLLHVGRVTKEKRIDLILDALEKIPDARLVITSEGPYRPDLKEMVKERGMKDRVTFTGYIPRRQLDEIYASSDLFVIASNSETQAIVLLEAASSGLPIVAVDAPVTGEFVRKHNIGWVTSTSGLAEAIGKALKSKKKVNLPKGYTEEECTKKLIKFYKNAIEAYHAVGQ